MLPQLFLFRVSFTAGDMQPQSSWHSDATISAARGGDALQLLFSTRQDEMREERREAERILVEALLSVEDSSRP